MAQNTVEMREREAREEGMEAEIDYRREDEVIVVDRWSVATRCTSNMILMVRLSKRGRGPRPPKVAETHRMPREYLLRAINM